MSYPLETIFQAYLCLKETLGNTALGIKKNLVISPIELNNKIYYLIQNYTNKNFELILEDGEVVTLNNKYFITPIKPIKANQLLINTPEKSNGLATLKDIAGGKQIIVKQEHPILGISKDVLNPYFKDCSFLNTNEDYSEYLYAVPFPKQLIGKVQIKSEIDKILVLFFEDKQSRVVNTCFHNNVFYTNNITRLQATLDRYISYIPNEKLVSLRNKKTKYRHLLISLQYKLDLLKVEDSFDEERFIELCEQMKKLFK